VRWSRLPIVLALAAALASPPAAPAQPVAATRAGARKATTVVALASYPVFFHAQAVRVRGTLQARDGRTYLRAHNAEVLVAGATAADTGDAPADVEVTGAFFDVGRLEPGDPRLAGVDIATLWRQPGRSWPGVGELQVLRMETSAPAEPFTAPSVRTLALDPTRYADQRVTVSGRFHGFNLYGDLPDAPVRVKHAFVLQAADAAIWVTGLQPKGPGFALDVNARMDTNRWLEVSGTVIAVRGIAVVEGQLVSLAKAPATSAPAEPAARVAAVGPRPEVVFSLPAPDETDLAPTTTVRIQFSRDLDPKSLAGGVRVSYVASKPGGPPPPPSIAFTTSYNQGLKVLELRFAQPLEPFAVVHVELSDTIRATDGPVLVPWTLKFTVGG